MLIFKLYIFYNDEMQKIVKFNGRETLGLQNCEMFFDAKLKRFTVENTVISSNCHK